MFNFFESSIGFKYQIYFFEPKSANSFKFISPRAYKCFMLKLLLYILYLFLYLHDACQVTYLLKKQENIHPENVHKFRNGNDLFLLYYDDLFLLYCFKMIYFCYHAAIFSREPDCVGATILCPHRVIVTTIVTRPKRAWPSP